MIKDLETEFDYPSGRSFAREDRLSTDMLFGPYDGDHAAQLLIRLLNEKNLPITPEALLAETKLKNILAPKQASDLLEGKAIPDQPLAEYLGAVLSADLSISKHRFVNQCWFEREGFNGPMLRPISIAQETMPYSAIRQRKNLYNPIALGNVTPERSIASAYYTGLLPRIHALLERSAKLSAEKHPDRPFDVLSMTDDQVVALFCKFLRHNCSAEHIHPTMLKGLCPLPKSLSAEEMATTIADALATDATERESLIQLGTLHFQGTSHIGLKNKRTTDALDLKTLFYLARRHAGLSLTGLAAKTGIDESTISDYENGRHPNSRARIETILTACGLPQLVDAAAVIASERHNRQTHETLGYRFEPPETLSLPQLMRNARIDAGWTQGQLAGLIGLNMRTIGKYEAGDVAPENMRIVRAIFLACEQKGYLNMPGVLAYKQQVHGYHDLPKKRWTMATFIRNTRVDLGMTEREFATQVGLDQMSIHNYEKGLLPNPITPFVEILDTYNVQGTLRTQLLKPAKERLGYTDAPLDELTISQLLQNARIDAGLSHVQLAQRAEMNRKSIARYEEGGNPPNLSCLQKILIACGKEEYMQAKAIQNFVPGRKSPTPKVSQAKLVDMPDNQSSKDKPWIQKTTSLDGVAATAGRSA